MLVLSRRPNESLRIGDNIIISVVEIRNDKVRLGIEAPHSLPVHRQEVYDSIKDGSPTGEVRSLALPRPKPPAEKPPESAS